MKQIVALLLCILFIISCTTSWVIEDVDIYKVNSSDPAIIRADIDKEDDISKVARLKGEIDFNFKKKRSVFHKEQTSLFSIEFTPKLLTNLNYPSDYNELVNKTNFTLRNVGSSKLVKADSIVVNKNTNQFSLLCILPDDYCFSEDILDYLNIKLMKILCDSTLVDSLLSKHTSEFDVEVIFKKCGYRDVNPYSPYFYKKNDLGNSHDPYDKIANTSKNYYSQKQSNLNMGLYRKDTLSVKLVNYHFMLIDFINEFTNKININVWDAYTHIPINNCNFDFNFNYDFSKLNKQVLKLFTKEKYPRDFFIWGIRRIRNSYFYIPKDCYYRVSNDDILLDLKITHPEYHYFEKTISLKDGQNTIDIYMHNIKNTINIDDSKGNRNEQFKVH